MERDKNHIGTVINYFKDVATHMGARFSHGNITEMNFRSALVYPYIHINIGQVSVTNQVVSFSINLLVADRVNTITTENQGLNEQLLYDEIGYTENNNYAMVLQQLYVDLVISLRKYEELYYNSLEILKPYNLTPFEEKYDDVLAGYTCTINIEVVSPIVTDGFC